MTPTYDVRPDARATDRYEAPAYLARYQQRAGRAHPAPETDPSDQSDGDVPLYLRRFRARTGATPVAAEPERITVDGQTFTPALAEVTRGKEISAPVQRKAAELIVAEVSIIRHGITQGYSTDAGLTPMGAWQAHRRGHELSRRIEDGERVRLVCAATNRARQTAGQLHRGVLDGLALWGRTAEVSEPQEMAELRNFAVSTPDGLRDVTSAFRQYQALMEKLERMAVGDRPRWLVEIDRFYRTQYGGADPIQMWLTVPLMYFEPPQACVRRFWLAIHQLTAASPGVRVIAATHSGPMRAFATWAHGYDPGEPLNTEEIRVKIREGGRTALVSYRNRVTEVHIPPDGEFPRWDVH